MRILPVFAVAPPALAFICFALILLIRLLQKKDKTTLYFMLAFFSLGICYLAWGFRSTFLPPYAKEEIVFFWFKFSYMVGAPYCTFLALAALELLKPEVTHNIKNMLLFALPMVILEIWALFSVPTLAFIAGQNDAIWPPALSVCYALNGAFYLTISNYVFIWFLFKNKGHSLYKKVIFMELGLIFLTLGTIIEATKIGMESWGVFIRWFIAVGGFLMMYGYIQRKTRQ